MSDKPNHGALTWTPEQIAERSDRPVLQVGEWTQDTNEPQFVRDPAEEACYEIQKALWEFQTAIERCESASRLAFIDGMLAESRKRLDLVIIAVGAKQVELDK